MKRTYVTVFRMAALSLKLGDGLGLVLPELDLTPEVLVHLIPAICAGGYSTSIPLLSLTSLLATAQASHHMPPLCNDGDCGCSPHLRHLVPTSPPSEKNLSSSANGPPPQITQKADTSKTDKKVKPSNSEKVSNYWFLVQWCNFNMIQSWVKYSHTVVVYGRFPAANVGSLCESLGYRDIWKKCMLP